MKNINRREALGKMGELALVPFIPNLTGGNNLKNRVEIKPVRKSSKSYFSGSKVVLAPFDYQEIKLTHDSFSRQLSDTKNYYLQIPNDDLLKGFRKRMNLPTYGAKDLGGWYSSDVFNIFGQILSGLCRMYAVSGDENCKEKSDALIEGWAACIEPDGYFYYSKQPNALHYVYDKMVGGLVDAYIFTDNDKALTYLSTITDWAIKNLNKSKPYASIWKPSNEWYTLSENLYRAYQITQEKKYFDFAQYWEYTEYWNLLAENKSIFTKNVHYHAYSHLNTLSGAAMAYMLKGENHYLDIIKNGYTFFQNEECFATGGYGPDETLLPKDKIVELLRDVHNTFETQCGSWAVFKLSKYLLMFTGNARYGDWIEKLLYNGAGADIPMSTDGRVLYYSDYNPRESKKENYYEGWTCCCGTRPQDVAEYSHLIYFRKDNSLFVNLYVSSRVDWDGVRFIQTTRFPEQNFTTFELHFLQEGNKRFTLNFRKPEWLTKKPMLSINGKLSSVTIENNWIKIKRDWENNDKIKLILPMELKVNPFIKNIKSPTAITYGPAVLAVRTDDKYPVKFAQSLEGQNPFSTFVPVKGMPLNWHVNDNPGILVRPYYAYKEGEKYLLYFDPSVQNRVLEDHLKIEGNWKRWKGCDYFYSKEKDASISTNFKGTGIRLYLIGFLNSGKCEVWLDGKIIDVIDEYQSENHVKFEKTYQHLPDDIHQISLKVLGEKNQKSKDNYINFRWFEYL